MFFDCWETHTEIVIRNRPSFVTAKILTSRARVSQGFMAGGGPLEAILCVWKVVSLEGYGEEEG